MNLRGTRALLRCKLSQLFINKRQQLLGGVCVLLWFAHQWSLPTLLAGTALLAVILAAGVAFVMLRSESSVATPPIPYDTSAPKEGSAVIRKTAEDYGYREIRTPIFEATELFTRSVGESSDIVTKEMYTFLDKGERWMTLRPEGTAPVIRAFVERNLNQAPGLSKYYYIGPMFRYERPQAGRYRQLHQFGAEAIGIGSPEQDVEMIDLMCEIYRRLGLKNLVVHLNSVGDEASRAAF
jgi:hypothetical protein